ncbi:hypothetical protein ACFU3E_10415 [Streptomyces sp. NPDC057424]|uniref:hypothetical protein n=1 Tax=Streptomyces sp. NPDC057424 TaxID=3346127 RepID=UPI0036C79B06
MRQAHSRCPPGTEPIGLIALASITMMVAVCCASTTAPALRVLGCLLGGVLALVLVPFNGTIPTWEGLIILAVMFLGTAVCRAEHGQSTWRCAACTAVAVVVSGVASAYWHGAHGAAASLRVLAGGAGNDQLLGLPVHPVLLAVSDGTIGRWRRDTLVLEVAFYAVLLPLSMLTCRYIEAPIQRWGRKLARRMDPP